MLLSLFGSVFRYLANHLNCLFHAFYGDEFMDAMEIIATGKDVRTWQAHEGEASAIGAAADRLDLWDNIAINHRLLGYLDDVRMGLKHFTHIEISIRELQFNMAFT